MKFAKTTGMISRWIARPLRVGLVSGLCVLLGHAIVAQDKPSKITESEEAAPEVNKDRKVENGHDRPSANPRIRFKAKAKKGDKDDAAAKTRTRIYLLEASDAMNASVSDKDGRETTRLDRMVTQMKSTLDSLAKRKNANFNFVSYGSSSDLAGGADPLNADDANVKKAKKWLDDLTAEGDADLFPLLKEVFDQDAPRAHLVVGGAPSDPTGVDAKVLKAAGGAQDYILAQVKAWREAGKTTSIDISGIDLGKDERAFYKKLARAAGGTYLDI